MPHVIEIADHAAIGAADLAEALGATGFHPEDPENLAHAARLLRRLGNNRDFLADIMLAELAAHHREEKGDNGYGPQAFVLSAPGATNFFLRANIWPSPDEHMFRASGGAAFVYGLPHDHNFHFLTLGYFGPGYWSDYYEYDYEAVTGHRGEAAGLRFVERARLEEGKIQLYRAHVDVHSQLPPDALSVSLNIMHTSGAQGWLDQYAFDLDGGTITRMLSAGSSEAFIRIAVGLGSDEALDLAERFGRHHPSDRMRFAAWSAMAGAQADAASRDAVWQRAETAGSRLVAAEVRLARAALG